MVSLIIYLGAFAAILLLGMFCDKDTPNKLSYMFAFCICIMALVICATEALQ